MTQIDSRLVQLDSGAIEIPMANLTQEYEKDVKIVSYYILERLPKSSKFNLKNWEIDQYSSDRILIESDGRAYLIMIYDIVASDGIMNIEFNTYLIRE